MKIPIHREGWRFIVLFAGLNAGLFWLSVWLGWIFVPLTLWCVAFFRDPERVTPGNDDDVEAIISPADGVLLPVVLAAPPAELGMGPELRLRLSIFMNVFNVHVNRVPLSGTVAALAYREGGFFNASFDKASEYNERMSIRLRIHPDRDEEDIAVVQIAGLIARRIKCDLVRGQSVRRGERFGIIRFGSRVDVYLPAGTDVLAAPKQRVKAGETVLARLRH